MRKITLVFIALLAYGLQACAQSPVPKPAEKTAKQQDEVPAPRKSDAPAPKQDVVTFALAGDIMMGTTFPDEKKGTYLPEKDGAEIFRDVAHLFQQADVAAANLEGVIMEGGKTTKSGQGLNSYIFRMPPRYVKYLVDTSFDLLSVANNHVNDFGNAGVSSTHRLLKEAGIAYSGMKESCPTAVIERAGKKIGFAAFGHSRGTQSIMDYKAVKRIVSELDTLCDIVVVSFHGGGEGKKYQHVPHAMENCFGEQRGDVEKFAHTAIDAGADIVYGHGPHVNRAVELYNDRIILYSLGNFCTPYRVSLDGVSGYAPVVTVTTEADGRFIDGKIHSFIQQRGVGPRIDSTNKVAKNIRSLTQADFPNTPLEISDEGIIARKTAAK